MTGARVPLERWVVVRIALVCAVAFFINCQPSEPYLTQYLQENKNLTEAQLDETVWPADLYASLAFMLPVGIAAEALGYVPIIFLGLLCREATRVVLIFSKSLTMMVVTQVTYAVASIANSVLLSYLFTLVPPSSFVTASLLFKAAYAAGNVAGSALGQLIFDHADVSLTTLFYVSWGFTSLGLGVFLVTCTRTSALPRSVHSVPSALSPSQRERRLPNIGVNSSDSGDSGDEDCLLTTGNHGHHRLPAQC